MEKERAFNLLINNGCLRGDLIRLESETAQGCGAHWAVAWVASLRPDIYKDNVDRLVRSLDNPDPDIRGYTLVALKLIDAQSAAGKAEHLKADTAAVSIYDYDTGTIKKVSVAALAEELLGLLK